MLSDDANENSKKKSVGLTSIKEKQLCTSSTLFFSTFLCRCFAARLQRETSRNFLVTGFMCSCSLFFRCRSFLLWWTLKSLHFITAVIHVYKIVLFFFQRNLSPCFSPFGLALFLLSTSMKALKLSRIKQSALLLLFLSLKVQEAMRFTVKTRRCLKCKISFPLTWRSERTFGRTPYERFSQNQNFLDA